MARIKLNREERQAKQRRKMLALMSHEMKARKCTIRAVADPAIAHAAAKDHVLAASFGIDRHTADIAAKATDAPIASDWYRHLPATSGEVPTRDDLAYASRLQCTPEMFGH